MRETSERGGVNVDGFSYGAGSRPSNRGGRSGRTGHVCVLGADLDVSNRGVLALGRSIARLIADRRPQSTIAFHYSHATGGVRHLADHAGDLDVQVLNCRMSPFCRPSQHQIVILALALLYRFGLRGFARRNPWLSSILAADLIGDIRGGDSFSDIYGLRRFVVGGLPLLSVVLLGRPFVLFPQTYGPFNSACARQVARLFLNRASVILSRDENSIETVNELCGRQPKFCPDVAFTLNASEPNRLGLMPDGFVFDNEPLVGFNVSGLLYNGGYTGRNMFGLQSEYKVLAHRLLQHLLASTSAKVLIVPHEFGVEGEEQASLAVASHAEARHPGRVFRLTTPLTESELKWVIGRTEFFLGSRMHACIAALSQGIPTVGLAYSDKFLGVFRAAGVGDAVIDLRSAGINDVLSMSLSAYRRRSMLRTELHRRVSRVKLDVSEAFDRLLPPERDRDHGQGLDRA